MKTKLFLLVAVAALAIVSLRTPLPTSNLGGDPWPVCRTCK